MKPQRAGKMHRAYAMLGVASAAFGLWMTAAMAIEPERVTFPSFDIDVRTGEPIVISALYFSPDPSSGGYPAVIGLHGCGGMYSSAPGRRTHPHPGLPPEREGGRLSVRHQAMAELLLAEGYAVLFPDSFTSRGRRNVCSFPIGQSPIVQDNRRLDVLGALTYLRSRPDIDAERIALLGWSHGGSAVLASVNLRHPVVAQYLAAAPSASFFRTAVAFYPGCFESLRTPYGFAPATRVDIFIGESDDWTSPRSCVALASAMAVMSMPLSVTTYPDAYHGFDAPNMARPLHLDVPNGVNAGRGVTIAPNRAARDDAYARMKARLRDAFAP